MCIHMRLTGSLENNSILDNSVFVSMVNSVRWKTRLSDGCIGSIGQSDFHQIATVTKQAACTHP